MAKYLLLDIMLGDMKSAPAIYRPTSFWEKGLPEIVADMEGLGVEQFRRHPSALYYYTPTYALPAHLTNSRLSDKLSDALSEEGVRDAKSKMMLQHFLSGEAHANADYRVLLAAGGRGPLHTDRASESVVGNPAEQFNFDGRNFSRSFLNYLLGISFLRQHCDCSEVKVVMEVGGGFGTLGEILLGDDRNKGFYIDVDIPPTSFVSTYYLKQVLGDAAVADYGQLREAASIDIGELRKKYKAAVICPWLLPRLTGKIDLFVNFISFQEMEPAVVRNYLSMVAALAPKYVLLRNLREGAQLKKSSPVTGVLEPIRADDYDGFLPDYRLTATNTIPFGFKTVDNFHSELRLYTRQP